MFVSRNIIGDIETATDECEHIEKKKRECPVDIDSIIIFSYHSSSLALAAHTITSGVRWMGGFIKNQAGVKSGKIEARR